MTKTIRIIIDLQAEYLVTISILFTVPFMFIWSLLRPRTSTQPLKPFMSLFVSHLRSVIQSVNIIMIDRGESI